MTKYQHLKHAFGIHRFKRTGSTTPIQVKRKSCGEFDPEGNTQTNIYGVDTICCECGKKESMGVVEYYERWDTV